MTTINQLIRVCILLWAFLCLLFLGSAVTGNTRDDHRNSQGSLVESENAIGIEEKRQTKSLCDHPYIGCDLAQRLNERNKRKRKRERQRAKQTNTCSNLLKDPADYVNEVDDHDDNGECPQVYQTNNN